MGMPKRRNVIRESSRAFEAALPADQRKKLGQFFTGISLGKLLAHIALDANTKTVLDPMAGHGDLLDVTLEVADEKGIKLSTLDGIEIDDETAKMCRKRLVDIIGKRKNPGMLILSGDAFEPTTIRTLQQNRYNLVITNPPYIRYQALKGTYGQRDVVRQYLGALVKNTLSGEESDVLSVLVKNYSGLADLSIPSWMLASMLVKPGGRIALVVPATWRNRDYADVIKYLLLRCFSLEYVVEDTQPGWFSDALVRTTLVIAKKLNNDQIAQNLSSRKEFPDTTWIQISPKASSKDSIVGSAFRGKIPEAQFSQWLREESSTPKNGITLRRLPQSDEWGRLRSKIGKTSWCQKLEGKAAGSGSKSASRHDAIPDILKELLSEIRVTDDLTSLDELGIRVGQGLRTGCNRFFYVTALNNSQNNVLVQSSSFFGNIEFRVPVSVLKPVLRRQSEIDSIEGKHLPIGRVLDLRKWVLPEDYEMVKKVKNTYNNSGEKIPNLMPDELAAFVRMAANTLSGDSTTGKRIPDLSAVRTNVRTAKNENTTPKFWYMLPDFTPRHTPNAFVARINHGIPWIETNLSPPILIDANFSTFWSENNNWNPYALKALLNSSWCRAYMEVIGTQLGGGALKLEATHLRQMIIPYLSHNDRDRLAQIGEHLSRQDEKWLHEADTLIFNRLIKKSKSDQTPSALARIVTTRAHSLSLSRRKVA